MDRHYDIFEIMPDGTPIWKDVALGHENAIAKLKEIAAGTRNEVQVMHIPTKAVIAVMNAPQTL